MTVTKEDYYLALRQTQGTIRTAATTWQPWLMYFLRALVERGHLKQQGGGRGVWYELR